MESATLQSRVAPAQQPQRSLSLPSYARAGGEGIDHRLIFAALEQEERVRRKSRLFARKEKRQNSHVFCLPIKSSNRCRETSFSSDTSCSSLEYQKPIKGKKEELKGGPKNGKVLNGLGKPSPATPSAAEPQGHATAGRGQGPVSGDHGLVNGDHGLHLAIHVDPAYETRPRGPAADFRSGIGSSGDSMERSSRSSSDSLSRKERMVALKARVEAQREKFGRGSSSEDEQPRMTRYNSDDVIHRTVREVKSRSSRMEKRMRRRSQDEWMLKRAARRQNVSSLYIAPGDEDLFGHYHCHEEPEVVKTDFCPSPQFPDLLKKSYFSDFPSRENMSRFVKDRIKCIEDEETRRRSDSTGRAIRPAPEKEVGRTLAPLQTGASLPADRARDGPVQPPSPTPRSPHAPTPPPRSPKSLTFVNKAFLQHQNATSHLRQEDIRSPASEEPAAPSEAARRTREPAVPSEAARRTREPAVPSEAARRTRELMSSRRKTCSNFDFLQDIGFNGSTTTPIENREFNKHSVVDHEYPLYGVINGRANDAKGSVTNMENFFQREMNSPTETKVNMLKNKWNKIEQRRELQFNSLESKKNPALPSWIKRKCEPQKHACLCSSISKGKQNCFCSPREHVFSSVSSNPSNKYENKYSKETFNLPLRSSPSNRLSKSEANIAAVLQPKISPYNVKIEEIPSPVKYKETSFPIDNMFGNEKQSATANLESAMEELESIYQSLKFSSDNFSEMNSLTNASDEDFRQNYNILLQNKRNFSRDTLLKPSGSCPVIRAAAENAKVSKVSKSFPSCSAESFKIYVAPRKFPNPASVSHSNITASPPRSSVSETLCIDEMFNDLTRQLDFEQKLLKESREHKTQSQPASHSRSVLEDKMAHQKQTSPLESIVSIRRELYNNLYGEDTTALKTEKTDMAKKKHKAVRSLSANISCLMGADDVNMASGPGIRKSSTSGGNRPDRASKLMDDRGPPPHSRDYISSPTTFEGSRSPFEHGTTLTSESPKLHRNQYQKSNEIRQIRVSMDASSKPTAGRTDTNSFSRMTPVICQPRNKSPLPGAGWPETPADAAQSQAAPLDAADEAALEELLRSLLVDAPARRPAAPPGESENVIFKRNLCLKMMDACMTPNPKNDASKLELPSCNKGPKDQKEAQRLNDTSQNNNAHPKTSFIPVYAKRSDACHNLPRDPKDSEAKPNLPEDPAPQTRSVLSFSPPYTRKNIIDNEVLVTRTRSHLRRHSVGFEDITSATYCYGRNFTNDKRFQTVAHNPNISSTSIGIQLTQTESGVTANYEKPEATNPTNHNAKLSLGGNENETALMGNEKPLLQRLEKLKDKSFKRKSSLNRIDFIHLPMPSKDNKVLDKVSKCEREQRNSSSDENDGFRPSQKPSQLLSKRKHNCSVPAENRWEKKADEVALSHESATNSTRSKAFPRFNPLKLRNRKINYANASHYEKLSYSAGELESLASDKTSNSKTCLSAQEFDGKDNGREACMYRNSRYIDNPLRALNLPTGAAFVKNTSRNCGRVANTCDTASQIGIEATKQSCSSCVKDDINCSADMKSLNHELCAPRYDNVPLDCIEKSLYVTNSLPERCNLESAENGIYQEEVSLVTAETTSCIEESTSGLQYLEISADGIEYPMSEENNEPLEQDPERRPSSILRKSYSEERRELHGILKPTPEEKLPRSTLPSILKHRESSEEKEPWSQQNDLHSILKKSASEDESYNSGTDVMIRPILKNNTSTDEECSSGGGNTRPRPILKKRTSFQEECSYACYASGELKPILKKNKSLSSGSSEDQQPKPILKTRRKSEDGRVAAVMAEFATRPRAYSADMGVKERFGAGGSNEGSGFERDDSASKKCDQTDL